MRLEKFHRTHVALFKSFGKQAALAEYFQDEEVLAQAEGSESWSLFDGGTFIGCGGLLGLSSYRALAWVMHNPTEPRHFFMFHRVCARILNASEYARIEAYIDTSFAEAVRWAKCLGFTCETETKPFYFPDGRTASEWVLLRDKEWQPSLPESAQPQASPEA